MALLCLWCVVWATLAAIAVADTTVSVNWNNPVGTVATTPTFQVVAHPLLMRGSPIHDEAFATLAGIQSRHVRYVPWLPYPKLGVAELNPPSGTALCGGLPVSQGWNLTLDCGFGGGVIANISFASYGTPAGSCGNYTRGACHAANSSTVVAALCVGRAQCAIPVPSDASLFGDPCFGVHKQLAVQAICSNAAAQHTYWDWTNIDPMMEDFWEAVNAASGANDTEPVINFSTPPNWLFANTWAYPDDPAEVTWSYETGDTCKNLTALGQYYGRLVSWYVNGGFTDEYGVYHARSQQLNITNWEVLNEVAHEHAHTKESYTQQYDAIVHGIRAAVDPVKHPIAFTGLAMANIDPTDMVVDWVNYFLNASNHVPGTPLDWISYHAYPTANFGPDPAGYVGFFDYVDEFTAKVDAVEAVRMQLSPSTKVALNEVGTIADSAINEPLYWVASAGYFAYMYMQVAVRQIALLGQSQFIGAPGQFPSVSMIDWTTGRGNARYWLLKMLVDVVAQGVHIFNVTMTGDAGLAGAVFGEDEAAWLLLVNKRNAPANVTVPTAVFNASALVIDQTTGLGPARTVYMPHYQIQLLPYATAAIPVCHFRKA